MPLKIKIKPGERVLLGTTLIENGEHPTQISILNQVPILREKDLMNEEMADSAAKKLYYIVQVMYIEQSRSKEQYEAFLRITKDLIQAAPSLIDTIYKISEHILAEAYYPALKEARALIEKESELIRRVTGQSASPSVPPAS
ncbi:MAG: flagellar biosynthesis repressor FlbT [Verrucomicrobiota bacterium]